MSRQGHFGRDGTASVLATMLLVIALVAQTILGSALQLRAAEPDARLDAVLCLSQPAGLPHESQHPGDQPRHSADCVASCQLSASGPAESLAVAITVAVPDGASVRVAVLQARSRFVLNAQAFLAAARAPPSPSA